MGNESFRNNDWGFGNPPPEQKRALSRQRGSKAPPIENTDPYEPYYLGDFIDRALINDTSVFQETRKASKRNTNELISSIWGGDLPEKYSVSPSLAAFCLRWWSYDVLGEKLGKKPTPRTAKDEMRLRIGSASHYSLLSVLKKYGQHEVKIVNDELDISGRIDFKIKNPKTQEVEIVDLKFTGDYGFKMITKEGLPPHMKNTKSYNPGIEARRQVLLYMWMARQNGENVVGNVIYIDPQGNKKECIIPWDPEAEYDANQFVEEIKQARQRVLNGELADPTVRSEHVCSSYCVFRQHCEFGQKVAAKKVRLESKRRPSFVRKLQKKHNEELAERMKNAGVVQGMFGALKDIK